MTRSLTVVLAGLIALAATSASADMTMKMSMSMTGPVPMEMGTTLYIKGMKMRTDAKVNGQDVSLIVDLATRQRLMIQHATKTVQEFDPAASMAAMPVSMGEPSVSLTPTGEKKDVLGRACQGFDLRLTMPMTLGDETVTMVMAGPAWIAKEAPGVEDYRAFFKAAADSGIAALPFAQGPQSKGMPEMQKAMAENGITLEQEIKMSVEGSGQMAQMMGQVAMALTSRVTELTTDSIPDAMFEIPAGYTKK